MVSILVCDENRQECATISEDCKNKIAELSDDELELTFASDDSALKRTAEEEKPTNLLYYEFCGGEQTSGLRLIKKQYSGIMTMLITEATVSPLAYLKPDIAPDSLLLRPIRAEQLDEINREFIAAYFERRTDSAQDSFLVDTRMEKTMVPYASIYYFEAREKKLFLRTRHGEYAFYGTIDQLERKLPPSFRRCHRSYIVNLKKLIRIVPADNYLELANQITIPISRSYKNALKEVLT